MKYSTGSKIIIWADVLFALCIVALILSGVLCIVALVNTITYSEDALTLLSDLTVSIILFCCAVFFYLSNLLLRGFGEMVNNSNRMTHQADIMIDRLTDLCDMIETEPEE